MTLTRTTELLAPAAKVHNRKPIDLQELILPSCAPSRNIYRNPCETVQPVLSAKSLAALSAFSPCSTCSGTTSDIGSVSEETHLNKFAGDTDGAAGLLREEATRRTVRAVLNKLTRDHWEPLYEQLASSGTIQSKHDIDVLVREVFHKGTEEEFFAGMYADLCARLQKDERLAWDADGGWEFRRLLLNQCGEAFDCVLATIDDNVKAGDKQQALGSIRFIGHLLVKDVISPWFFIQCAEALLSAAGKISIMIEFLVGLLFIAGPHFDKSSFEHFAQLEAVFSQVTAMASSGKLDGARLPSRLRFLLQDVVDLRSRAWKQRSRNIDGKQQGTCQPWRPSHGAHGFSAAGARADFDAGIVSGRRFSADAGAGSSLQGAAMGRRFSADAGTWPPQVPFQRGTHTADAIAKPGRGEPAIKKGFNATFFQRKIASIFRELCMDCNVAKAVRQVRELNVPESRQADEFTNIITRAAEETRGSARRSAFAFAAGLAAAERSAFDRAECLIGLMTFFTDVYDSLSSEVPRLEFIAVAELIPTMQSVFPAAELQSVIPTGMCTLLPK